MPIDKLDSTVRPGRIRSSSDKQQQRKPKPKKPTRRRKPQGKIDELA